MDPTTEEGTTQAPRRQSCDRCHGHKVRCTRPDNRKTGACDRCLRKGAVCAYSSCLPKGRPSLYRLSEVSGKTTRASSTSPPSTMPATPDSSTIPPALPITPVTPVKSDGQNGAGARADAHAGHEIDVDVDMDVHGGGAFAMPVGTEAFPDFWSSCWSGNEVSNNLPGMIPGSTFNIDPALEVQSLSSLTFPEPFPGGSTGNNSSVGSVGRGHAGEDSLGLDNDFDTDLTENSSMTSSSCGGHAALVGERSDVELSIAHLSWLSTRLTQLLGSSRAFLAEALDPSHQSKNHDPTLQVQVGIEALSKSVNTWLVYGSSSTSTASGIDLGPTNAIHLLHHVFSASNHLLEILRHVRESLASTTPRPSTTCCPSPPSSSRGSHMETASAGPPSGGSHPSPFVNHLVVVCVMLLLNKYIAILIALQRSADTLNFPLHRPARNLGEPDDDMDTASRVHLQLVSVVQMCSYFIKRQNQALDMIISSSQGPPRSKSSREQESGQSVSCDATRDLKVEVEQRLKRLKESLCII